MKTLIFSDTHLTARFEKNKFDFLKRIISNADRVIINGDFWDGYLVYFDDFIKSKWSQLFPLLKEKHTIYIWGNHDEEVMADDRVYEFAEEVVNEYSFEANGTRYRVTHGDQLSQSDVPSWDLLDSRPVRSGLYFLYMIGEKLLGRWMFYLNPLSTIQTLRIQTKSGKILSDNEKLICGHTHQPIFNSNWDYINCGYIQFGHGYYLLVDDAGCKLHYEQYE